MAVYELLENGVDRFLLEDATGLLLMEEQSGGISQPTPNGGDIIFDDDAHGDSGRDLTQGSYSDEDLYLKSEAFGYKASDGTTHAIEKKGGAEPHYLYHVNIKNGDDVSTAVTTWRGTRHSFAFDDGKGYIESSVGTANRRIRFGSVYDDGVHEPMGYDGVDGTFGSNLTALGDIAVYGSHLRAVTTSLTSDRSLTIRGTLSDLVDSILESIGPLGPAAYGGKVQIGIGSTPLTRAVGNRFNGYGGAQSGVASFSVVAARRNVIGQTGGSYALNVTNTAVFDRDTILASAPGTSDLRASNGGEVHVDLTWTGRAKQVSSGTVSDFRTWLPTIVDAGGNPASGKLVELFDNSGSGVPIVSATTDPRGQISYAVVSFDVSPSVSVTNAVRARKYTLASGWVEDGPFTVKVDGVLVLKFVWPRTQYTVAGTTYDQLLPVRDTIPPAETLKANFSVNPGGGRPTLAVQFTDRSTARPGDPITAWAWNFGDGGTDTVQNPSHTYIAAGLYTVSLTVTDASGTSSETDTACVYVYPGPAVPGTIWTEASLT